ncbi:MAG: hypothetical protein QOG93_2024 [Gaiellaceae bacterium]|jgi:hypothetical protein|nr:hypothetical protein [Gaiellaceae bacterium]MDX6388814.1 hypothetical protein [Gaiellaceae bacterium]MDX6437194.1 hypothetical protein [Gaiellaceae bacterium]
MTGVKGTWLRRRLFALLAVGLASFAAATSSPAAPLAQAPATALKSCSSGFTHAVIGGAEKCLRAGEFCAHRYDSQYRRYGYRCIRFYANVDRYRLTHG